MKKIINIILIFMGSLGAAFAFLLFKRFSKDEKEQKTVNVEIKNPSEEKDNEKAVGIDNAIDTLRID